MPKVDVPLERKCIEDIYYLIGVSARTLGIEVMQTKVALYLRDHYIEVFRDNGKPAQELTIDQAKAYYSAAASALKSVKEEIESLKRRGKDFSECGATYDELNQKIQPALSKIVNAKDAYKGEDKKDEGRSRPRRRGLF